MVSLQIGSITEGVEIWPCDIFSQLLNTNSGINDPKGVIITNALWLLLFFRFVQLNTHPKVGHRTYLISTKLTLLVKNLWFGALQAV